MQNEDFNKYIAESKSSIISVLDAFKIGHSDINTIAGPTVTLFEFKPAIGVRMSKIRNLKDELTIALDASSVRVIAPIPERGTVGIEVPNKVRQNVPMMEMLYSEEYMNTTMDLPLVLGRKVDGGVFMADLAKMPHLLVAGATGMGKSVGLNVIISSLLNKLTPNELKLVLVDPKQVELSVYETIAKPYLAHLPGYPSIITEPSQAKDTLDAVIRLMESRYTLLKNAGVRNLQDYNATASDKLPYYVVIIDEYGDLILSANDRSMEQSICRIAQKARAVGIHMIISTQRPDTKIVTGNIKANFPTRIAFRTTTGTDSRVILDRNGAERLTGRGDMLFFDGSPELTRCQCAYISTEEVNEACRDMAEEWSDATEALLPEDSCNTTHRELDEETKLMLYRLPYMTEIPYNYGLSKFINETEWRALNQLREIGVVDRFSRKVIVHNIDEILAMAKTY